MPEDEDDDDDELRRRPLEPATFVLAGRSPHPRDSAARRAAPRSTAGRAPALFSLSRPSAPAVVIVVRRCRGDENLGACGSVDVDERVAQRPEEDEGEAVAADVAKEEVRHLFLDVAL
mmetsp:Transcript_4323/g.11084  ORF Transcript_4323/g.11084 Transcript_4323/m.11084 type:complete len:118 (+) Transcript_4323:58-411(+)